MHYYVYIIPSSHKIHSDFIAKANVFKERKEERNYNKCNCINEIITILQEFQFSLQRIQSQIEKNADPNTGMQHTRNTHTHTPNTTNNNTNIHTDTERGSHLFQVSHIAELYTYLQTNIRTC